MSILSSYKNSDRRSLDRLLRASVLLFAANLLFFGWQSQNAAQAQTSVPPTPQDSSNVQPDFSIPAIKPKPGDADLLRPSVGEPVTPTESNSPNTGRGTLNISKVGADTFGPVNPYLLKEPLSPNQTLPGSFTSDPVQPVPILY